ncbi:MAG TPA: glycosyltransferase family 4 protein, partial [Solirubrobacterales bacterium]|nr:glycosyltransferase family 4 protein [Solirubrobacterales bacterium]
MRVLIFHGYMLRGTGSNIYNVNLAPALARLGHEVHLLCQDREVKIPGVQIHNPDIGGLLPVYVKDPYEGFEVKAFPELTEAELAHYLDANVAAVRDVADRAGGIDAALANHEVMGPAILARADVAPFAVKAHGSALEYTVKPHPRFLPYAYEGMDAANCVLVGSAHTGESLWAALPHLPDLKDKTRLGPPGVDVEEFAPQEAGRDPLVVFVGKLIVSKGVDLLLAAWPLVHAAHPGVRLRVAGFGAYEDGLRRLQAALDRGDLDDARAVAAAGRGLEGGEEKPLPILAAFLADPPPGYAEA